MDLLTSAGGHTAGLTGKRISGGKVQAVIALDPAGPLFNTNAPNDRVASSDALVFLEISSFKLPTSQLLSNP